MYDNIAKTSILIRIHIAPYPNCQHDNQLELGHVKEKFGKQVNMRD